jgi:hypothetical protein
MNKDFGLNEPQDLRRLACEDCGMMDASVRKNYDEIGYTLCDDCYDRIHGEDD